MAAPQWSSGLFAPSGTHASSRKGSSTPRAAALAAAAAQQGLPATAFTPLGAINTVTVALCLSLQSAMSQVGRHEHGTMHQHRLSLGITAEGSHDFMK